MSLREKAALLLAPDLHTVARHVRAAQADLANLREESAVVWPDELDPAVALLDRALDLLLGENRRR